MIPFTREECMSLYYDFIQCTKQNSLFHSSCQKKLNMFVECYRSVSAFNQKTV